MENQASQVPNSYWRPGLVSSIAAALVAAHSIVVITSARCNAILRTRMLVTVHDHRTSSLTARVARRLSMSFQMLHEHHARMTFRVVRSHAIRHCLVVICAHRSAILAIVALVYRLSLSTAGVEGHRTPRCAIKDEMRHLSACASAVLH